MIIGISQLRVVCIIGCNPDERLNPQTLFVDLRMTIDDPSKDQLDHTIDYVLVSQAIEKILVEGKFQLLEIASQSILEKLFIQFPLPHVLKLWIRIEKPLAYPDAKYCYVEHERSRV